MRIVFTILLFCLSVWSQTSGTKEKTKSVLFETQSSENSEKKRSSVIKFSVVEAWSQPYAFYDDSRNLVDGIVKEFIEAIARKMNSPFEHVYMSRNRVESGIKRNQIDVRCLINEAWTEMPEIYTWSQGWYEITNTIVWKKGRAPLKKLDDINGKTLGSTAGYTYKPLVEFFKSGKAKRSDVATEAMNLILLQKDRIDYAIVERTAFEWFLKENGIDIKGYESLVLEKVPVKCAVSKSSKVKVDDINEAISKLRQEGFFKRLDTKYGFVKN